jgi:hypothetical protein
MFARSVLLFSALFLLALASAGDAEARRLRLFMGFSRATSAPKPEMPGPARTGAAPRAAPSSGAAPASRSGGVAIGSPVVAPLPSLSEERRGPDEAAAKGAAASQPPVSEQRRGPALGFETVSAESASKGSFESLSLR